MTWQTHAQWRYAGALVAGLSVVFPLAASATQPRTPPDRSAMREAVGNDPFPARYISSRSIAHYLRGAIARESGDSQAALSELKLATLYDPENPYPQYAIAAEHLRRGDLAQADAAVHAALTIDRAHVPSLILRGRIALRRGRVRDALDSFREASQAEPDALEPLAGLVDAHLAAGDLAGAATVADRVSWVETNRCADPDADCHRDAPVLLRIGNALAAVGVGTQARAMYELAARRDPANPDAPFALAQWTLAQGSTEEAATYARRAAGLAQNDASYMVRALRVSVRAGHRDDIERVASLFRDQTTAFSSVRGRSARTLVTLGDLAWDSGDGAMAVRILAIGRQVGSDTEQEPAFRLGVRLIQLGRHAQAAEALKSVTPASPLFPSARVGVLAAARLAKDDLAAGIKALVNGGASSLAPAMTRVLVMLQTRSGRLGEAVQSAELALARAPDNRILRQTRLEALEAAGKPTDAMATASLLLRADAEDPEALLYVARSLAARPAAVDEAERVARQTVASWPEHADALELLGNVLMLRGQEEALAWFERAAKSRPESAALQVRLAESAMRFGRLTEAKTAFARVLTMKDGAPLSRERAARGLRELSTLQARDTRPVATVGSAGKP